MLETAKFLHVRPKIVAEPYTFLVADDIRHPIIERGNDFICQMIFRWD